MIIRDLRFALIVMFFLSIFSNESVANSIQSEPIIDDSKSNEEMQKPQANSANANDALGAVGIKKDVNKIHGYEFGAESSRGTAPLGEYNFESYSISHPIFREQESVNGPVNKAAFDARNIYRVDSGENKGMDSYSDHDFTYKDLLGEIRFGLGEGVYSKLVWTYYDLKDLDDRIYASMVGYDLSGSNILGKLQQFIGVDEQINAMIVFGSMESPIGAGSGQNHDPYNISGAKVVLDLSQNNFARKDEVNTGRFQFILMHLTIKNVLYSLLILMGVGMVWRIFRFFVKQDLS